MADTEQQQEIIRATDAVENTTLEEVETSDFWDNDTTDVPEHYVRAFTVTSSYSDVTMLLGSTYWESGLRIDLCKLRLIMTHHSFLSFAEDVRKHSDFITKLYKRNSPGPDFTTEEFAEAWEELHGED